MILTNFRGIYYTFRSSPPPPTAHHFFPDAPGGLQGGAVAPSAKIFEFLTLKDAFLSSPTTGRIQDFSALFPEKNAEGARVTFFL